MSSEAILSVFVVPFAVGCVLGENSLVGCDNSHWRPLRRHAVVVYAVESICRIERSSSRRVSRSLQLMDAKSDCSD
jgi:hypothetical protein